MVGLRLIEAMLARLGLSWGQVFSVGLDACVTYMEYGVREYLLDHGFEQEYGARPLRRAVERYIEDPLAEEILRGRFENANGIQIVCNGNDLLFLPFEAEKKRRPRKTAAKKAGPEK